MNPRQSDFHQRCRRLYQALERTIGKRHKGEVVAIDEESGQYVFGKEELKVALEAKRRFGRPAHFFRFGYEAVHKCRLKIRVKRLR